MTFTYTPIATSRDQVRLELGDTDETRALFADEEIDAKLDARAGNVLLTAADLCDILATRFAREYDFEWQGAGESARGKFSRSQMAKMYADRAVTLRDRATGGIGTITTTRIDGYSDDLSTRDGAGTVGAGGRVRSGYSAPDLPA
jgi:hypothetical protein